ncbi:hypothetical protein [Streptomyces sp. NPDC051909]|uniref:hypothetical protein n=1 Tax=Streptomyces sp. NPDC051909 TaxID=3154944 RepID=UPI00341CFE85
MATPPLRFTPALGWRFDRIPGTRGRMMWILGEDADRLALPLHGRFDGQHKGDGTLWMTGADAEKLHADLCHALAERDAIGSGSRPLPPPCCEPTRPRLR